MSMNSVFYWCVSTLKFWAAQFHITYEEINVWIFVIIFPIIFFIQFATIIVLALRIRTKN